MYRAAILAAVLLAAPMAFAAPVCAMDDNDPHMRFPPYSGSPPYDSSQPGGNMDNRDGTTIDSTAPKRPAPATNAPAGQQKKSPDSEQKPGGPSGSY